MKRILEFLSEYSWYLVVAAFLVLLGLLMAKRAHGDEFVPPDQPCSPTLSDYARAYDIDLPVVAAVWWCDMPSGLETRYITGTPNTSQLILLLELLAKLKAEQPQNLRGGEDLLPIIRSVIVREPTPEESMLVTRIIIAHGPHCYVTGTAATAPVLTATAQGTLGPPRLDDKGVGIRVAVGSPVSCGDRLAKETLKRYCNAENLTDTKLRRVPAETWTACKLERAPAGGWPQ